MTLLQWQDNFSVGVAEVDHEHRELIGLINTLHDALGTERGGERVEAFLGEIFADISAHFALEERVMRERRYDALAEHKADHERLLDQLRDMMDEQADGAQLDDALFGGRLEEWFARHFATHDARFHRHLVR
ncbi:MAG: hemerythrin family protein [Steroidobacteraceae bacterium]|nr:hemerythrin family protein [Steroidobacteraceae bacterium]